MSQVILELYCVSLKDLWWMMMKMMKNRQQYCLLLSHTLYTVCGCFYVTRTHTIFRDADGPEMETCTSSSTIHPKLNNWLAPYSDTKYDCHMYNSAAVLCGVDKGKWRDELTFGVGFTPGEVIKAPQKVSLCQRAHTVRQILCSVVSCFIWSFSSISSAPTPPFSSFFALLSLWS